MRADPDLTTPAGDLPPPPLATGRHSLFFDLDGTLVELAATPDSVVVAATMAGALRTLAARMPGRIGIVSGRSVAQLDALLGDLATTIAVAGSHGAEIRLPGRAVAARARPPGLDAATVGLARFADERGALLERKSYGSALHFRAAPHLGEAAETLAAALAAAHGLVLQRGKMLVEVRAAGDKGAAITTLMEEPEARGTTPLFFGDDVTDEPGFAAAAAAGGAGVLIGEPRATAARHRLPDVSALHDWLAALVGSGE